MPYTPKDWSLGNTVDDVALDNIEAGIQEALAGLALKANIANPTFTGTVSGITKSMVGLGSVDNTADTAKPVSTAQQTALNLKANLASPTFTGTVAGITKTMVGLGNLDNTADIDKPISTLQQAEFDNVGDSIAILTSSKADISAIPPTARFEVPTDITLISSTTMTAVTNFKVTAAANSKYDFSAIFLVNGDATADAAFDFTGPTGGTIFAVMRSLALGTGAVTGGHITQAIIALSTATSAVGLIDTSTWTAVSIDGWMKTVGTAGDFQLRWKQNASVAVNNVFKAGSFISSVKVA